MSSYLVLARKYRPKDFGEVLGQDVVTEILKGALSGGHLGHAYLFAGPRGTGKTTLARIFAKCLNCERGPTPDPCGECGRCQGAESGSEVDIIELDAASHTGVDNIRELRDEVAYAPMRGRYKVYIVDEVHMLSKAAFNALLKTLEEPPAHVVFLFATTDPHRVLDTVLSRCQILRLAPLPEERIVERLEYVFGAEGVRAEEGITQDLARRARGGMRDALSQADKLLAFAGDEPKLEDLRRMGGEAGPDELEALLACVETGDRPGLLERLHALEGEEEEVLEGLLDLLRSSALLAWCGEGSPLVAVSGSARAAALERGRRLGAERIELWMQELLRARERVRTLAGQEHVVLELCLLELARSEHTIPLAELVQRLEALEGNSGGRAPRRAGPAQGAAPSAKPAPPSSKRPPASSAAAPAPPPAAAPAPPPAPAAAPAPARAPAAPSHSSAAPAPASKSVAGSWDGFLDELRKGHAALAELLARQGASGLIDGSDGGLLLRLSGLSQEEERLMGDRRNRRACEQAAVTAFGRALALELSKPGEGGAGAAAQRATPRRDGLTQRVMTEFEGTVEELS